VDNAISSDFSDLIKSHGEDLQEVINNFQTVTNHQIYPLDFRIKIMKGEQEDGS